MRKVFILIISITVTHSCFARTPSPNWDSLKQIVLKTPKEGRSTILVQLARQVAEANPDSALSFLSQAVRESESDESKGNAYFQKSLLYRYLGRGLEQSQYLDSAYNLLAGVNDSIAADVLYYRQILLADKGKYKEALQTGYKNLALQKKLRSKDKELNAILQIGYTYDRMGEYRNAIEWYEKGLKVEGVKKEDYIGRNYGLIGIAYDELKDYEKAVSFNLKAIEHFKKQPNSVYLHSWYSNLGNTYTKMGKLDLAEKYTRMALEDKRKKRYVTRINLGKILLEKGNTAKAEIILKNVLKDLENTDQTIYLSEAYFCLSELYKKKNDFRTALAYYEKYKSNEDVRLSIAKVKQLNELTIQYEAAEKERKILEQHAKIADHQLVIKDRNLWIFGLVALALIIGLIGFLLFKQQVLKNIKQQKDNELKLALERAGNQNRLQEQRLSISRDLHDNIGAQLSFIVSAIDTIKYYRKEKDDLITNRLDNIGAFAKETIQELRDTIWAMNKSGIAIKDLQSRIANFIEKAKESVPGIAISVKTDADVSQDLQFTALQGLNIFRIIQEATNNSLKYAEANLIRIEVSRIENGIQFRIQDDGKGFDENEVEAGNGLLNMRKRALDLGSELMLLSVSGRGCTISFNVKAA
ncbi:MAG TPA: tetratricopeptide repeat protein [Ginsengibacter sp.]|nr:tetratricopeptide repeat protein [Ginsengibacter sp.]HRP17496.1 tetratricopeptide repeat protein [Ginsengibacter sp.]HUN01831.1 tetratricopeptide repeat protein [Niabella sp.]